MDTKSGSTEDSLQPGPMTKILNGGHTGEVLGLEPRMGADTGKVYKIETGKRRAEDYSLGIKNAVFS